MAGIEQHFNRHLTAAERRAIASALDKVVDAHHAAMDLRRAIDSSGRFAERG